MTKNMNRKKTLIMLRRRSIIMAVHSASDRIVSVVKNIGAEEAIKRKIVVHYSKHDIMKALNQTITEK